MKVAFHYSNPIQFDVDCACPVDVYIDLKVKEQLRPGMIRIVILEEPRKGHLYKYYNENRHKYTRLLTFHEELVRTNPKARRFLMMRPWIADYTPKERRFAVSTVVGGKFSSVMEGYGLRHNLWFARGDIKIPREFYLSGTAKHWHTFVPFAMADYTGERVLGISKEPMFDCEFHIAIENTSIHNYFSEKLLDCFRSRTVPIYYGCRNIGDFFDIRGILVARNLSDIVTICNSLTKDSYKAMIPFIEENYRRSEKWMDVKSQVEEGVKQVLTNL
jgi:hypothetical protein